jgi:hypothetical protein
MTSTTETNPRLPVPGSAPISGGLLVPRVAFRMVGVGSMGGLLTLLVATPRSPKHQRIEKPPDAMRFLATRSRTGTSYHLTFGPTGMA